ncbi:PREDICTED: uncharacterized protein LOC105365896 [Ceratosolen solmsi marchali]|uniref:Uncharacterized protein LOC105365896 n=1 Tax=Ceratosolen solmsi marchali TaxID=326594 RepID=A0AAJ6YQQ4_9HYME|nr:PREDICTED: uncharacterized protein LOC105365896 [Ceratosolen solmsi marchali]
MNTLLTISLICVTILTRANSKPNTDFRQVASDLLKRSNMLKDNVNDILTQLDNQQATLNQKTDTLNFEIPQNPKIIELESILKQYELKKGISTCIQLKDEKVNVVIQELKDLLRKKITEQLNIDKLTLNSISLTLQSISENIQGSNLDVEIKFCEDNMEKCRLTNEYSGEVDHSQKAIDFINTSSQTLIDAVLKTEVYPILSGKVTVEIYGPVMLCIKGL